MTGPLLSVKGLETGYAGSQVLFGVDLDVGRNEVVSLMGRNGMGKTTTVLAIMGLLAVRAGEVRFDGRIVTAEPPFRIAQAGIGLVPEGRQIFPTLTVEENLVATAIRHEGDRNAWTLDRVYTFLPRLAQRRRHYGDQISGGEQQMLAIGRALMTNPRLLILDEATEGLAPLIRQEIWERLAALKRDGLSILVIDKNVEALMRLSNRHLILEKGRIVWSGTPSELAADPGTRDRYLSV
ncbi:MAG TPA: ABC transporter ATP-binding protein [Hyphomicrobiaceae bacterium]|nr:ABC transporter ATP-binding protein [Hyphomicrobiaceae bacterium]